MADWRYMENFVNGKSQHIGKLQKLEHCWRRLSVVRLTVSDNWYTAFNSGL